MSNVNLIQSKIMQLEGGAFQSLFDEYLYKKYKFTNIQTLGIQTATNKPTKGTPDAYVLTEDGKYILINYGSVSSQPARLIFCHVLIQKNCHWRMTKSRRLSVDIVLQIYT